MNASLNSLRSIIAILGIIYISSVLPSSLQAQEIHGTVYGSGTDGDVPLAGAHVYWEGTSIGGTTDDHGHFHLDADNISNRRLTVSHVAYEPETVPVGNQTDLTITLTRLRQTEEVEVSAQAPETYIAPMVQKTEVITAEELEHAACCDLSGCFGTTSSVQPEAVDIITDTRQLTMLGLDGVYTQVLIDNVPHLTTGLNTHLGVSFIPGPFIDRITVSKGANSVLQGSESFSGLINVLMHESDENKPLFFNAFTNSFLSQQYNAYVMRASGPWSGMLAAQGIRRGIRTDRNSDGFLDAPLTDRFSVLSKFKYFGEEEGVIIQNGIKYTWENRLGGQEDFERDADLGGINRYGQLMDNRRLEFYNKSEFAIGDESTFKLHGAASFHSQDAWYGPTSYEAEESMAYVDASYTMPWADEHQIAAGGSFRYSDLGENIELGSNLLAKSYAGKYETTLSVPGLFAENKSYFLDDALTVIAGLRADFYEDHGSILTPRAFARYAFDELTTVRASIGSAFRVARPFVEHPAALGSWRDIRIDGPLDGERALNYGINLTHLYEFGPFTGTTSLDLYRTEFSQQVVAEYDDDPSLIVMRNLEGSSASDNIMAEITATLKRSTLRLSYTYSDVYEVIGERTRDLPFVSRHRVLGVLTTSTADDAWQATLTAEWRGAQVLPRTTSFPVEFQLPSKSDPFTLLHLHIQRSWDSFDLYAGIENLLDYRQDNPIINPFARYFETAFAWGPVKGREAYGGIRARLNIFD